MWCMYICFSQHMESHLAVVDTLYKGMSDYISEYKADVRDDKVNIDYTFLSFDLVDKDLDYDEESYVVFMHQFLKQIQMYFVDLMKSSTTYRTYHINISQSIQTSRASSVPDAIISLHWNNLNHKVQVHVTSIDFY